MQLLIFLGLLIFWLTTVGISDAYDRYLQQKEREEEVRERANEDV